MKARIPLRALAHQPLRALAQQAATSGAYNSLGHRSDSRRWPKGAGGANRRGQNCPFYSVAALTSSRIAFSADSCAAALPGSARIAASRSFNSVWSPVLVPSGMSNVGMRALIWVMRALRSFAVASAATDFAQEMMSTSS